MQKIIILLVLLVAGNISLNATYVGTTNDEVRKIAIPIGEKLFSYKNNNDYTNYIQLFSEDTRKHITKKVFDQSVANFTKRFGKITSYEYLGHLNQDDMTASLWKVKCKKTKKNFLMTILLSKQKNGENKAIDLFYK